MIRSKKKKSKVKHVVDELIKYRYHLYVCLSLLTNINVLVS